MDSEIPRTVVFGAGPSGLGAAWTFVEHDDPTVLILELQNRIGGLAGTFERDGCLLDYGPHKFYTQFGDLLEKLKALMGEELLTVPKRSGVWLAGRRLEYPVNVKDLVLGLSPTVAFRCGLSYAAAILRQKIRPRPDRSYEDYIVNRFGRGVYRLVFEPLAAKVWGDPSRLDADLARVRVVIPSLGELLLRMLFGDRGKRAISSTHFYYPRRGFIRFWERIHEQVEQGGGTVLLESHPVQVALEDSRVASVTYEHRGVRTTVPTSRLVSSIPLTSLLSLLDPVPPPAVLQAAAALKYRASILLFITASKPRILDDGWIFFPERRFIFNRIAEQKLFSAEMIPEDRSVLTVDICSDLGREPWTLSDEQLFERAMDGLEAIRVLAHRDVTGFFTVRIPKVYPVYDVGFRKRIDAIWAYLDTIPNLISAGRHGYFQHNNSDNALDMGIKAARHLLDAAPAAAWDAQRRRFHEYQIVD